MPIEYSCFISYQRGNHRLAKRMIDDLLEALASEIELYIRDKKICIDEEFSGGDLWEDKLAKALCKSACMIMVFTPSYFDRNHTYCAREYKAMEKLEKSRIKHLKKKGLSDFGLIIPIIFRGKDHLPEEIKRKRQCYYFDSYMLCSSPLCTHPEYAPNIKAIADSIYKLCKKFEDSPEITKKCEDFKLPSENEIRDWLDNLDNKDMPFPGGNK